MAIRILIYTLFLVGAIGCFFDKKEEADICLTDHIYQEAEESLTKSEVQTTAVTNKYKHWPKGSLLKIFFIDVPEAEKEQVLDALELWGVQINGRDVPANAIDLFATEVTDKSASNVRYRKSNGNGSWAYVGRSDKFNTETVTINSTLYSAPHEWGHVLGRSHEHQNGMDAIVWNKPYVYEYMAKRGWNKSKVDHNFFRVFYQDDNHDVDPVRDINSVMHYRFPKEFVMPVSQNKLPTKSVRWPSARDKSKAVEDYPVNAPPPDPVDCVLGPWSAWSACDKECGGGKQQRTREVITPTENGGKACDVLIEYRDCNTQPCETDPVDPTVDKEKLQFAAEYFLRDRKDVIRLDRDIKVDLLQDLWGVDTRGLSNGEMYRQISNRLGL